MSCPCKGCEAWESLTEEQKQKPPGDPLPKPHIPSQFKWKPMLAANKYWTYLITCRVCKWQKFSDYWNVQEWLWVHYGDNCVKPYEKWRR